MACKSRTPRGPTTGTLPRMQEPRAETFEELGIDPLTPPRKASENVDGYGVPGRPPDKLPSPPPAPKVPHPKPSGAVLKKVPPAKAE